MDAAACIGCGVCVAACPNSSAALFTAAKVSHLALVTQGQPERSQRVLAKEISMDFIARMNREYLRASLTRQVKGLDTAIPHSESS